MQVDKCFGNSQSDSTVALRHVKAIKQHMIKAIDFENLSIRKKINIYDFHQLILSFTLLGIRLSRPG